MKQIHLIANAHLDPVWLWRWEEGCTEALSTFRTAVEIIDTYPNFIFNHNESILYKWVEENDKELFADIKRCVDAGRWNIMGGWYLQPDCNMPTGESFVRNIMTGRKYFGEKFGKRPTTAINFDSFGHSKGLVQLMKRAGYDSYLVYRGGQSHKFKEHDFYWEGLDDSVITVHRSDEGYNSIHGKAAEKLKEFLDKNPDENLSLFLWGVGDHGGGPTKADMDTLAKMHDEYKDKADFFHSTPEDYFKVVRSSNQHLPTTDEGLNPVAEGCYTSQSYVKLAHRKLENELFSAEKMLSAAATQYDFAYPHEKLEEAKDDLLFSQFHDALPGSATKEVEEDTLRIIDHGLEIVAREKMRAFLALEAGNAKVIDGTSTFFIYNHHPFEIIDNFDCDMALPVQNWDKDFKIPEVFVNGERVPTQCEKELSNFGLDWRKRVTVHATLKPSSMTRFDVYWKAIPARPTFDAIHLEPYYEFDNGEIFVKINTGTGLVDSFKVNSKEQIGAGSFSLVAHDDSDSPWGIGSRSKGTRPFALAYPHEASQFSGIRHTCAPSIRVIEDGEVRTVVEAIFTLHNSHAYMRYILPKKGKDFEIETGVDWGEKEQYLKMEVNTLDKTNLFGQIVFGREPLNTGGREITFQKWIGVSDDINTLAIINDGVYGGTLNGNNLGLTLLRSAAYTASADNTGPAMREIRYAPRMDQGMHIYRFKVVAGDAAEVSSNIDALALAFNEVPYKLAHIPSGRGTAPKALIEISDKSVMLSCFKAAEDKNGYIVRLYETQGKAKSFELALPFADVKKNITLTPFEIKTMRLTSDKKLVEEEIIENF